MLIEVRSGFDVTREMTLTLPGIIVGILAVIGGVVTAIAAYFWIHGDTSMTVAEKWEHIWALLFFFFLGNWFWGLLAVIFFRMMGWL